MSAMIMIRSRQSAGDCRPEFGRGGHVFSMLVVLACLWLPLVAGPEASRPLEAVIASAHALATDAVFDVLDAGGMHS